MAQQVRPGFLGMIGGGGGEPGDGSSDPTPNGVPGWSGRVKFFDDDQDTAMVSIHVSDTRSFSIDGFEHVDFYEGIEGEVEHHIFRRIRD